MGSVYMSEVMGVLEPRVALVNVGEEEKKGNELTKAVTPMLKAAPIHFIGNIEMCIRDSADTFRSGRRR